MNAALAKRLGLALHARKRPLPVKIADGSIRTCSHFVRTTAHIGTWNARMAFTVMETGIPLVIGMPLFMRFEPTPKWRLSQYIITDDSGRHVLKSELIHNVWQAVAAVPAPPPSFQRKDNPELPSDLPQSSTQTPQVSMSHPPSTIVTETLYAITGFLTAQLTEPSEADREEIARLTKTADTGFTASRPTPTAVANEKAQQRNTPLINPLIIQTLSEFEDVLKDTLLLGLQPVRPTYHRTKGGKDGEN